MITSQFHFDFNFQIRVIALMLQDVEFLLFSQDAIDPEYFTDSVLSWYFTTIKDHYVEYQTVIDQPALLSEVKKSFNFKEIKEKDLPRFKRVLERIFEIVPDKAYISKELINFCKVQAIKKAAFKLPSLINSYNFKEAETIMMNAFLVGESLSGLGSNYFKDIKERARERELEAREARLPTGITEIDARMNGGLRPGQLGIWQGPTGKGKSIVLCHCGKRQLIVKKKVIHFSFELKGHEIGERYDANFTKIKVVDLIDQEAELISKLEKIGKRLGNNLLIKYFEPGTATINTLKTYLKKCLAIGFKPDLIIVDYLDLMKPLQKRNRSDEEYTDIAVSLKGWAGALEIPIWTATQSNRGALSKEFHTEENMGESFGKAQKSDVIITMNQSLEEKRYGLMRLLLAKNRNGASGVSVPIFSDLDRMRFYLPGSDAALIEAGYQSTKDLDKIAHLIETDNEGNIFYVGNRM